MRRREDEGSHDRSDLPSSPAGGLERRLPVLDMVHDGFDHHDRVIDHDADRKDQAEHESVLIGEPSIGKKMKVPMSRDRHGEERDDSGADALQEDEDTT